MGTVLGYLRHYRRWDGSPGLTLEEQKQLVLHVARRMGLGRGRYYYLDEDAGGRENGWPALKEAIRRARYSEGQGLLVIIPTLDGVEFDLSFLNLLESASYGPWSPILVVSRRKHRKKWKGDEFQRDLGEPGWLLSHAGEACAFREMVARVWQRGQVLSERMKAALARGVKLGARGPASHQLTAEDRSKGGLVASEKRRSIARGNHWRLAEQVGKMHAGGLSLAQIAQTLNRSNVLAPKGGRFHPMQVQRLVQMAKVDR